MVEIEELIQFCINNGANNVDIDRLMDTAMKLTEAQYQSTGQTPTEGQIQQSFKSHVLFIAKLSKEMAETYLITINRKE